MTLVLLLDSLRTESLVLLGTLLRASLEATVVVGLVWGLCKATPTLPAAVRAWLWWLVSLKLVLGLLPLPAVALPWLPTTGLTWAAPSRVESAPMTTLPGPTATRTVVDVERSVPVATSPQPVTIPYETLWPIALLALWVVAAIVQAAGLMRALRAARYLRRHAEPAAPGIVGRAAQLVRMFALPVMPRVLASRLSVVPLLTGVFRPAILLPVASTEALSRAELDLVLGHELAHVRRGDLVWGWIPAIAARLFFFHPLARLAVREYLAAREEACDAEVLQTLDAAPADYGRLLVKLGVATTDDVLAAAGSSPTFDILKRRLIMLDRSRTPASRWWWTIAGATAVLVPLTLVAQPVPPTPPTAPVAPVPVTRVAQADDIVPVPPMPPLAPMPPDAPPPELMDAVELPPVPPAPPLPPAAAVPAVPAMSAMPPAPPAAPAPPAPPPPPDPQESRYGSRRVETPWVLLEPGGNNNLMSGDSSDRAEAERQRQSPNDTLLWFRYAGTPYVTRDAATIKAVRDAFGPVNALGEEMGRIGEKMGAQGSKQGAVGARQAELGARQAELAAQMARIAAEQAGRAAQVMSERQAAKIAAAAERDAVSEDSRRLAAKQQYEAARVEYEQLRKEQRAREEQLEVQMKAFGDQQRALGDEMRAFGQVMEVHGAEMKVMGRKMEAAVDQALAQVADAFGSAVKSGKATRAK